MDKALTEMKASINAEGIFVPMVRHRMVPILMPMAGNASETLEDAKTRVAEAVATGDFTEGYVVSRDEIVKV